MSTSLEPSKLAMVEERPLGENGMSQLIDRFLERADIEGFHGHDLRRTFATLVNVASGDEYLAMRLLRDSVPGLSNRYIRYPVEHLVESLQKYSPLRQAGEESTLQNPEAAKIIWLPMKPSPVSKTVEGQKIDPIEPKIKLVETGEDRSPHPSHRTIRSLILERRALCVEF